jgi:glycosyltransferase involved in cell wall biosynthesis
MSPLISIIVPVYGVEDCIQRCFESLYRQRLDERLYEIVVINDGTTDDSMQIVAQFSETHSNILTLTQANAGVSAARNAGIRVARGRYLLFVDPDDAIAAYSLDAIVVELAANPDILILKSCLCDTESGDLVELYPFSEKLCGPILTGEELFTHYVRGSACGVVFSKSFVTENRIWFDNSMINFEDTLFFGEALACAVHIELMRISYYQVYSREGSASKLWDIGKIFSSLICVQKMAQKMNQTNCSTLKKRILAVLIYQAISALTTYLILMSDGWRYLSRMNALVKQYACLPLPSQDAVRHRLGILLLNRSWYLLAGAFYCRKALRLFQREHSLLVCRPSSRCMDELI